MLKCPLATAAAAAAWSQWHVRAACRRQFLGMRRPSLTRCGLRPGWIVPGTSYKTPGHVTSQLGAEMSSSHC